MIKNISQKYMTLLETSFRFPSGVWFISNTSSGNLPVPSGFPCLTRYGNGGGNRCPKYMHGTGDGNIWKDGPKGTNANPASGLLPGNATNTNAGPLVPLDAGSHIFYILMTFH